MLKSLDIKNFESWEDASLNFSPGVNTLVGESDQGKSGIVRALKWNMKNRPQGDEFRGDYLSDKKEKVSVSIIYDDGSVISRERNDVSGSNGVNTYTVNGKKLTALRADLPLEVSSVSKIKDVNIQSQHPTEQYFLLADKPGEVAKKFNAVAGLSIMDKSLSEINSRVREAKSKLTLYQKEIKDLTEKIEKDGWIPKAVAMKDKIKSLSSKIEQNKLIETKITQELVSFYCIQNKLECFKDLSTAKGDLKSLSDAVIKLEKDKQKADSTSLLIDKIIVSNLLIKKYSFLDEAKKELKNLSDDNTKLSQNKQKTATMTEALKHAEKLRLNIVEPVTLSQAKTDFLTLKSLLNELKIKTDLKDKLSSIIPGIKKVQNDLSSINLELKKHSQEYHNLRCSSDCPVCGRSGL